MPVMLKNLFLFCSLLFTLQLHSQERQLVSKNFRFTDGIYMSLEEFQADNPSHKWEDVEVSFFTNPQTSLTQVERVISRKDGKEIDPDRIWGLSMDGVPSIRIPDGEIHKELPTFAALKLRGKICYFTYPDWRTKKVYVAAYNPLTGRPFRQGVVEREEEIIVSKMLHFETGEVADFTVGNFLNWIADDQPLVGTYEELSPEEREEKLFKGLLIYVDRNATYLKRQEK